MAATKDTGVDAVLIIYTPQGGSKPLDISKAIIAQAKKIKKTYTDCLYGRSTSI